MKNSEIDNNYTYHAPKEDQLAKRAIETQDEFLVEWCKNLCIIVETEED